MDFRKHIPRLDFLGDPVNSKISSPSNQSSFWGWFYSGMKLLSYEPVNNHWMNERIYGFLSKSETERILGSQEPGTYIIRISASQKGALIICLKDRQGIKHFGFLDMKALTVRNLDQTIHDLRKDKVPLERLYMRENCVVPTNHAFPFCEGL